MTESGQTAPDAATQALLDRIAPGLRLTAVARQAFLSSAPAQAMQTILLTSTACGPCGLDIFNEVYKRLRPSAALVVFGLFRTPDEATRSSEPPAINPRLPVWTHFRDQARRCGLELLQSSTDDPDRPGPARQHKAKGVYAFAVFRRSQAEPRLRIRNIQDKDAPRMRSLFAEVFSPNRMSAEHWQWKYGDNRGTAIGAWTGGEMVAFYGGVWRDISLAGQRATAVQVTDVMVSPRERGILRREGAFFLTAASFLECHIGYGSKALLGFGFPNERAFKAAALRRLYGEVDRIAELLWPPLVNRSADAQPPLHAPRLRRLAPASLPRKRARVNRLWQAMRRSLPDRIVGVRDWAYIEHRYLRNPGREYHFAVMYRPVTRRWLSLAVLAPEADGLHLRDVIGDARYIPALIASVRRSKEWQGPTLKAWITASSAHFFPRRDAEMRDLGILVPHCIWTTGPSTEATRGRWWLTSGDTDFL